MLNEVIVMGRLTKEPEIRYTQSQTAVASFTLAVDRDYQVQGAEKQTDWIECVAWKQSAEFIQKYFHKGSMAVIKGRLQTRTWKDNNDNNRKSTEVLVEHIYFGENKKKDDSAPTEDAPQFAECEDDSEDFPF